MNFLIFLIWVFIWFPSNLLVPQATILSFNLYYNFLKDRSGSSSFSVWIVCRIEYWSLHQGAPNSSWWIGCLAQWCKMLLRTPVSCITVLGFKSLLCSHFHLPIPVHCENQQVMIQILGSCHLCERPRLSCKSSGPHVVCIWEWTSILECLTINLSQELVDWSRVRTKCWVAFCLPSFIFGWPCFCCLWMQWWDWRPWNRPTVGEWVAFRGQRLICFVFFVLGCWVFSVLLVLPALVRGSYRWLEVIPGSPQYCFWDSRLKLSLPIIREATCFLYFEIVLLS